MHQPATSLPHSTPPAGEQPQLVIDVSFPELSNGEARLRHGTTGTCAAGAYPVPCTMCGKPVTAGQRFIVTSAIWTFPPELAHLRHIPSPDS